jgi:hypothetical protein
MKQISSPELAEVMAYAERDLQEVALQQRHNGELDRAKESLERAELIELKAGRLYLDGLDIELTAIEREYNQLPFFATYDDFVTFERERAYTQGIGTRVWNALVREHSRESKVGIRVIDKRDDPSTFQDTRLDIRSLAKPVKEIERRLASYPTSSLRGKWMMEDTLGRNFGPVTFDFLREFIAAHLPPTEAGSESATH